MGTGCPHSFWKTVFKMICRRKRGQERPGMDGYLNKETVVGAGTHLCSQHLGGRSRRVFEASLVYTVNSRLVRVTKQDPV